MGDLIEAFASVILEPLFEYALKGPGYLILRAWRSKSAPEPDGLTVVLIGIEFWVIVAATVWGLVVLL